jgi:hypothetical protein
MARKSLRHRQNNSQVTESLIFHFPSAFATFRTLSLALQPFRRVAGRGYSTTEPGS